jgi:hypothetical protein
MTGNVEYAQTNVAVLRARFNAQPFLSSHTEKAPPKNDGEGVRASRADPVDKRAEQSLPNRVRRLKRDCHMAVIRFRPIEQHGQLGFEQAQNLPVHVVDQAR